MAAVTFRQRLENIDYSPRSLSTYLVFVPGLSHLIQKVQLAKTLPLPPININFDPVQHEKSTRLANICKWSLRGSMTQSLICTIAFAIFQSPIFALLGLLALFEMFDTMGIAFKNTVTEYQFDEEGVYTGGMTLRSPFNVF